MSKTGSRNIVKNGTLINLLFFCRAVGIKRPKYIEQPIVFMEEIVVLKELEWNSIADRVKELREEYKKKRKESQKRRGEKNREEDAKFLSQFKTVNPKNRSCLSCDSSFWSEFGNRICENCKRNVNAFQEQYS